MKHANKRRTWKEEEKEVNQIIKILDTALLMVLGLVLFKFIPMEIYGTNILFDASMHIVVACFVLYTIYFFIDQNKSWRIPYLMFSILVLTVIAMQRIIVDAHNDVGVLIGLCISILAILIPRWKDFRGKVDF